MTPFGRRAAPSPAVAPTPAKPGPAPTQPAPPAVASVVPIQRRGASFVQRPSVPPPATSAQSLERHPPPVRRRGSQFAPGDGHVDDGPSAADPRDAPPLRTGRWFGYAEPPPARELGWDALIMWASGGSGLPMLAEMNLAIDLFSGNVPYPDEIGGPAPGRR